MEETQRSFLSTEEVCKLLGVSSPTLEKFRLYADCPIPFGRLGRRYAYDFTKVRKWVADNALLDPNRPVREKTDHERRSVAVVAGTSSGHNRE